MDVIQLDECIDCRQVVRSCENEGLVRTIRYPRERKTRQARQQGLNQDESVYPHFFSQGHPVLTTDQPVDDDNVEVFARPHPGVVILSSCRPDANLTHDRLVAILSDFKRRLPGWDKAPTANSIIEITQDWVEVRCTSLGQAQRSLFPYSDPTWPAAFLSVLARNAALAAAPSVPSGSSAITGPANPQPPDSN
jgi:hypothetical protein